MSVSRTGADQSIGKHLSDRMARRLNEKRVNVATYEDRPWKN